MPDLDAFPFEPIIKAIWLGFLLCWLWYARRVKAVQRREGVAVRFAKYWLPLLVAGALLGPGAWFGDGDHGLKTRFVPRSGAVAALGCLLTLAGVAFAVRARQVLGRNWSVAVQLKREHELIVRGPYRWVRHPIYSGLLLAFLGTAIAIGEVRALLALAIVAVSFWFKLRLEERWLEQQFGQAYADYRARVRALVPGVL